jgi:two-component system response regulator
MKELRFGLAFNERKNDVNIDNKYILLVEDNEQDEALTVRALQKHGIRNEIIVARDGEEALELLQSKTLLPQIVLLDLKLPKVDGLQVLKEIRSKEKTKYLPVVILTTSKEDNDVISGYEFGANAYVRKPVDFMEFTEAVKSLGLFWLLLNISPSNLRT